MKVHNITANTVLDIISTKGALNIKKGGAIEIRKIKKYKWQ